MNVIKCEKGHYYDADKFKSGCPYCNASKDGDVTISFADTAMGDDMKPTEPYGWPEDVLAGEIVTRPSNETAQGGKSTLADEFHRVQNGAGKEKKDEDDMGKTVSIYNVDSKADPVVGWLVGLTGESRGRSFNLKAAGNFIGRGSGMDICIADDNSVSRDKHATVIFDPKSKSFIAQAGDSRELLYVNDDLVLQHVVLKKNDILSLGRTKLMFIPLCDEQFSWEDNQYEA